jgi:hypothetical protein
MQAFPVGALNLLAVASAVAAQHGPESARRLCVELAANDELWAYIENRLGGSDASVHEAPSLPLSGADPPRELEPHVDARTILQEPDTQVDLTTIAPLATEGSADDAQLPPEHLVEPRRIRRRARANGVPPGEPR